LSIVGVGVGAGDPAAAPPAAAGFWASTKLLGTFTETATIVGWPLGSMMLSVREPTWFSFSAVLSLTSVRVPGAGAPWLMSAVTLLLSPGSAAGLVSLLLLLLSVVRLSRLTVPLFSGRKFWTW